MIKKILRALSGTAPDRISNRTRTRYHWRCPCGGHSRTDGWLFPNDAEYGAQRHQWYKGVGHQMPEVYSTKR
jgi:hypothetical protein